MTVAEFDNKLALLEQAGGEAESTRERLIFLLKAVEFAEELALGLLCLPKSELTEQERKVIGEIKRGAYAHRSPLLRVIQQRVISGDRKENQS